ncbi:hypothetical protein NPIL_122121, partial [Nephila pilipes]
RKHCQSHILGNNFHNRYNDEDRIPCKESSSLEILDSKKTLDIRQSLSAILVASHSKIRSAETSLGSTLQTNQGVPWKTVTFYFIL